MPDLLAPEQQVFDASAFSDPTNWKLAAETSMEGYHIKALHNESFYPFGFDNLNVVETFGPNSRIIFPFRRIEKLRDVPPAVTDLGGAAPVRVCAVQLIEHAAAEAVDSADIDLEDDPMDALQPLHARR